MRKRCPIISVAALLVILASSMDTPAGTSNLFSCDFKSPLAREWRFAGGKWELHGPCLVQTDDGPADPKKALFVAEVPEALSTDVVVVAKVRIDSWPKQSDSRIGITVCSDPGSGHGYNLVLHQGRLRFLHDYVAWSEGVPFPYATGAWYWLKLSKQAEELKGKAWKDGEREPADWMVTWSEDVEEAVGYPGLNGGSLGGPGRVSFAEFRVERLAGPEVDQGKRPESADLSLDGAWQVRPEPKACSGASGLRQALASSAGWMAAQVPGEIHLDLMKAGKMPDPAVGLNMPKCRWPETNSWWFRTDFEVTPDFLRCERQRLVFEGLDLYAQVFLNGNLVGEAADAFVPAVFEVKPWVRAGRNELVVRLTDGSELAPADAPKNPKTYQWPGRIWLRKPQFAWGWDWVDGLPNIGIWRGVRLEGRRRVVIHDLRLDTVREQGRTCLEMETVLENLSPTRLRTCALALEIQPPAGGRPLTRSYALAAPPGRMPVRDLIEIPEPKLWWPNGLGEQPLYRVVARVTDAAGSVTYDRRALSMGLRTIELDRRPLAQGTRFCFRVNGQDVYCRGGNLGPQDAILARVSDAKYRTLVAEARNAHFTMFRLNGVAEFEGPAFYEACDRAGILLWHDFMFACSPYPDQDERFLAAARAEIESAVRLYRHHPSIALWSANNECYGDSPKLFEQLIPDLCRQLDPRRPCWPGCPAGGNLSGDTHDWYCAFLTPGAIPPEFRVRFVTEYGILGPCHPDSIREYLGGGETVRGDANWRFHTQEWERTSDFVGKGIRLNYAEPEGLSVSEWAAYGQMWQAIVQGAMMEALRFQKRDPRNDCEGALIWSYTDCVGETGWAILDYYMRRKAAYYWFRRAAAPLKVLVRERDGRLLTRLVNDTLEPAKGTVETGWWRLDGRAKEVVAHPFAVEANGMLGVANEPLPAGGEHPPSEWLYAAVLRGPDGRAVDQAVWLGAPYRKLKLAPPRLETARLPDGSLEVCSAVFAHAVHTEDHGHELLSDNWFDLLPGVPVRLQVAAPGGAAAIHFAAVMPKLVPDDFGQTLDGFQDDFSGPVRNPNWVAAPRANDAYTQTRNLLRANAETSDPNHLLYAASGCQATQQEVLARIRIRRFGGGSNSRAGIGVGVDPDTSQGINLLFADLEPGSPYGNGVSGRQFKLLDDFRAWGPPGAAIRWETNTWYWLRLRQGEFRPGTSKIQAKVWPADGSVQEPANWPLEWERPARAGFAGILAGSGGVSDFDVSYVLIKAAGLPSIKAGPAVLLLKEPENVTVAPGRTAGFAVSAAGLSSPAYQWQRAEPGKLNFTDLPGATEENYTTAPLKPGDDAAQYRCLVGGGGARIASRAAVVTIDATPPALVSARTLGRAQQVTVAFSKPISACVNRDQFTIDNGVVVTSVAPGARPDTIELTTTPLTADKTYKLGVQGITDRVGNSIGPNSRLTVDLSVEVPIDFGQTVEGFQDDFQGTERNPAWVVAPADAGVFEPANGTLRVKAKAGTLSHLLCRAASYDPIEQEVLARIRVASFPRQPAARAGICVGVNPETSEGINLSFRDGDQAGVFGRQLGLVDDRLAWGPPVLDVPWEEGAWYWLRLRQTGKSVGEAMVQCKFWPADGTVAEPGGWQFNWRQAARAGLAGIAAPSAAAPSEFEVGYVLIKAKGLPGIRVASRAFTLVPPKR